MPRFLCSYAYDISCFADFTLEAETEAAAQTQLEAMLARGCFENVAAHPCFENGPDHERVFVSGLAPHYEPAGTRGL